MEDTTNATASRGATAPETEPVQPIAAGDDIDVAVDGLEDADSTDAGPSTEERRRLNAELRTRFLECNVRIQQARAAGDDQAEKAALSDRERIATEFVILNRPLAVRGARPMLIGKSHDREDHMSAAMLGLWEALVGTDPNLVGAAEVDPETGKVTAVSGWDPSQGTFGNFSGRHISGRVQRSVRQTENAYAGMSYNTWSERPKVEKARAELLAETGRTPSVKEIAARAGVTEATVHTALTAAPVSLDKPVGDEDGATLGELVATRAELTDPDEVERLRALLVARAERINAIDLFVYLLRNGPLIGRRERSVVETADKLGIGRGAVQLAYRRAENVLLGVAEPAGRRRQPAAAQAA